MVAAIDVGDEAVGEPGGRPPDQCVPHHGCTGLASSAVVRWRRPSSRMPWYNSSAAMEPSAMPVKVKSPRCQVKSAMPMINGMAAVIWLIGLVKSTPLVTQIRMPSTPTSPYSTTVAPPSTPGGIAEMVAPTLGHNDSAMATAAATQYAAVE